MSRENQASGFPTRSDTNWPIQSQKKASILNLEYTVEEKLYYPSSGNNGADQLCSYSLCFRIGKNPVTAKQISAFVFATQIVQSLFYFNTKFQASNHLL